MKNNSRLLLCAFGLSGLLMTACVNEKQKNTVVVHSLSNGWQFSKTGSGEWLPATVPGTVHTDLMVAGKIDDPYFRTNEENLQWIGSTDWTYKTSFEISTETYEKQHLKLRFNGLDTYASVFLNDSLILTADNMFRTWEVAVKDYLQNGRNTLEIRFKNTFDENLPKWKSAAFRRMAFPNNDQSDTMIALYARKAQFHYGWDWGPRLVTAGIWKPVELVAWDEFRIENLHVIPENVSEKSAQIRSKLLVNASGTEKASVVIRLDGKTVYVGETILKAGYNSFEETFTVQNPKLWWTNGLGEAFLYDYSIAVESENGTADSKSLKLGIRSIEVDRSKDSLGKAFTVKVNGIPVFMKGANHIPEDNFQNRVTAERYETTVKAAKDANMNMLRVWGGGIYEADAFYEACDRNGILVWQDMQFACGMYPGDKDFLASVKAEIIDNVARMRNHPSVAMYCGNNENEISWHQWGWKPKFTKAQQDEYERDLHALYYETIPQALAEADPSRFYTQSSPIVGWGDKPNSEGDIHYWGVWHGKEPFEKYNDNLARFVSEYGFQSYPDYESLKKFTVPADLELHSPVMLAHQRCMADDRKDKEYGNRLIQHYMDSHFRQPKDFESFVYVSQLVQALGMEYAIQAHRRAMPYTMGSLFWQINDCWPVASWSSIDYYGKWKAAHYKTRALYKPVVLIPRMENNELAVYATSDVQKRISVTLHVVTYTLDGKEVSRNVVPTEIAPNTASKLATFNAGIKGSEPDSNLVTHVYLDETTADTAPSFFHFVQPKDLALQKPTFKLSVTARKDGVEVSISSDVFAKNVFVSTEGELLNFSDNYFDLLPGITKTITAKTDKKALVIKAMSLRNTY